MAIDLDALKRAAEAATPGPWESIPVMYAGSDERHSWGESEGRLINGPPQTIERETLSARWFTRKEDGDYIAAAQPATVLELIQRLSFAEEELKRLSRCVDGTHDRWREEVLKKEHMKRGK